MRMCYVFCCLSVMSGRCVYIISLSSLSSHSIADYAHALATLTVVDACVAMDVRA